MRNLSKNSGLGLAIVAGAVLSITALTGWHAGATATTASLAPEPARIATVNLEKLVEGLQEIKDRDGAVRAKGQERQSEINSLTDELKKIDTELEALPKGSKERREKVAKGLELRRLADARLNVYQQLINLEKGEILADIYKKIGDTAAKLAEREGYDLILMDDRVIKLPENAQDSDVNMAIQAKRVIYARDSIDITDRLLTVMNSEYNTPKR